MNQTTLDILLAQGEGQYIAYKERCDKSFAREVCRVEKACAENGNKVDFSVGDAFRAKIFIYEKGKTAQKSSQKILDAIENNNKITIAELSVICGLSLRYLYGRDWYYYHLCG